MMEGHEEIESVVQMAKRLCKLVQAAVKLSCYTDCNSKPPLQEARCEDEILHCSRPVTVRDENGSHGSLWGQVIRSRPLKM